MLCIIQLTLTYTSKYVTNVPTRSAHKQNPGHSENPAKYGSPSSCFIKSWIRWERNRKPDSDQSTETVNVQSLACVVGRITNENSWSWGKGKSHEYFFILNSSPRPMTVVTTNMFVSHYWVWNASCPYSKWPLTEERNSQFYCSLINRKQNKSPPKIRNACSTHGYHSQEIVT